MPEAAFTGSWMKSAHKLWVKRLRRTSSLPELLQVSKRFSGLYFCFLIPEPSIAVVCLVSTAFSLTMLIFRCRFLSILLGQWMLIGCTKVHLLRDLEHIWMTSLSTFRQCHKQHQQLHFGLSNWMPSLRLIWIKPWQVCFCSQSQCLMFIVILFPIADVASDFCCNVVFGKITVSKY